MTAGSRGPLLVQDVVFTDEMAHFDRERIPERVVHAKGAGKSCLCSSLLTWLERFPKAPDNLKSLSDTHRLSFVKPQISVLGRKETVSLIEE